MSNMAFDPSLGRIHKTRHGRPTGGGNYPTPTNLRTAEGLLERAELDGTSAIDLAEVYAQLAVANALNKIATALGWEQTS